MLQSNITAKLLNKAAQSKTPLNGAFEITSDCNFNCRMCYIRNCEKAKQNSILKPYSEWKKVFDEAEKMMLLYALLTGGEPLLHPEFELIYKDLIKRGMLVILNTNGYLINSDIMELFKNHPPAKIKVTLYGASDNTYNQLCGVSDGFSIVSENIKKLVHAGFNVTINMTVVKSNVSDVNEILDFADNLNIPVNPTTYIFNTAENCVRERLSPEDAAKTAVDIFVKTHTADRVHKDIQKTAFFLDAGRKCHNQLAQIGLHCNAGTTSYWIHSNGNFGFCGMAQMKNEPDIFESGLKSVWDIAKYNASQYRYPEICNGCDYRLVCRRCFAMLETEGIPDTNRDTYTCRYFKAYTNELLKRQGC